MGSRALALCLNMLGTKSLGLVYLGEKKWGRIWRLSKRNAPKLRDEHVGFMIHAVMFGILGASCSRLEHLKAMEDSCVYLKEPFLSSMMSLRRSGSIDKSYRPLNKAKARTPC